MASLIDPFEARDDLKDALTKGMVPGFPDKRLYLPRSRFQLLVNQETIRQCLPDVDRRLLVSVTQSCPKLFAILIYGDCLSRTIKLEAALQNCIRSGLTDANLPLPSYDEECKCSESMRADCKHVLVRNALNRWRPHGREQFYTTQWKFLALKFETGTFEYDLHDQAILPIELCAGYGTGTFGDVREGKLNIDHARSSERVSINLRSPLIITDTC